MKIRRARSEDAEAIMEVTNMAYAVNKGDSGTAYAKDSVERFKTLEDVNKAIAYISVAVVNREIVGVIGLKNDDENRHFIGPLAVHPVYQGRGVAKRLLDFAEDLCEVTVAGVVSCKTNMIGTYERRGYVKKREIDFCEVVPAETLARSGLSFVDLEKSNLKIVMVKPTDSEMDLVMKIVNDAYKVELGSSGISFKSADRFVTNADARKVKYR